MRSEGRRTGAESEGAEADDPEGRRELDHLFSLAYEELRRLARSVARAEAGATLNPTALVNEAWFKLAGTPGVARTSQLHFKRIAARAMRQVLIEAARRRQAAKRGGTDTVLVPLDDLHDGAPQGDRDLLALDLALAELARLEPRQASVIEGRFFGGLEAAEIAEALGVSEATVLRDWRAAKAWLAHELRRSA